MNEAEFFGSYLVNFILLNPDLRHMDDKNLAAATGLELDQLFVAMEWAVQNDLIAIDENGRVH
jgi:hypothetical protein